MFKKISPLALLLLVLFSCEKECPKPPCADADLEKGLLAYYPFNGNANDVSGNGNNGVLKNGASFGADYIGRANKAATFDGFDDYIIVTDNGKLNADEMTITAMVMVRSTNRRHMILGKENFENASAVSWGIGQSLDVTNKWEFAVANSNEDCTKQHVFDPSINISGPETLQAGRWYQVICTFGNGKQSLYVDGKLKASTNRDFQTLKKCMASQLTIGGWWKNDIVSIDGNIDEVRLYNRVLSECEIAELSEIFIE